MCIAVISDASQCGLKYIRILKADRNDINALQYSCNNNYVISKFKCDKKEVHELILLVYECLTALVWSGTIVICLFCVVMIIEG